MRYLVIFIALSTASISSAGQRCEYILTARPGELASSHSLHLDAYVMLIEALDLTEDGKPIKLAANLKREALSIFNLQDIPLDHLDRLTINTKFDGEDAEISLFTNKQLKHLVVGDKSTLYFWKKVGTKDDSGQDIVTEFSEHNPFIQGTEWDRLPYGAQVGFRSVTLPNIPKVYLAVNDTGSRIVLGIDVSCTEVEQFVRSRRYVDEIISTGKSTVCRIPILRTGNRLIRKQIRFSPGQIRLR